MEKAPPVFQDDPLEIELHPYKISSDGSRSISSHWTMFVFDDCSRSPTIAFGIEILGSKYNNGSFEHGWYRNEKVFRMFDTSCGADVWPCCIPIYAECSGFRYGISNCCCSCCCCKAEFAGVEQAATSNFQESWSWYLGFCVLLPVLVDLNA